ncbi:MAG: peptide chain release factor 3, partial [Melioribacteraceae bacterium]
DEGLAQLFTQNLGNKKVVGVVGILQFDVLKYRLLNEYCASVDFLPMPSYKAFWLKYDNKDDINELMTLRSHNIYNDKNGNLVYIAETEFSLRMAKEKNPNVKFLSAIEHNDQKLIMENVA